ncbi:MAG TPA: hypothetical protein VHD14_11850 [Pseudolabrys sp.]|nr:hypothetical protein [Pseudolabrys sp.]
MRSIVMATAAVALLCGGAQAQTDTQQKGPAVGVGVICDTPQQAQQFVSLRAHGDKPDHALELINAEAKMPRACGVAAVIYMRDSLITTATLNGKLVQIVRINVVAGYNGHGWQRVGDMVQYAVVEGGGETI